MKLLTLALFFCLTLSLGCGLNPDQEKKVVQTGQTLNSPNSSSSESGESSTEKIIDSDSDGLSDKEELSCGTDPELVDSDEDGLSDYEECVEYAACNPLSGDTDGDGVKDADEIAAGDACILIVADKDGDGETPPLDCDDNDALVHSQASDTAGDGIDMNCRPDEVSCSFAINPNFGHPLVADGPPPSELKDPDKLYESDLPGLWTLEASLILNSSDGGKMWHETGAASLEVAITRDGLDGSPPSEVYSTGWFAYEFDYTGAVGPGWNWQYSYSTVHPECGPILKTGEGQTDIHSFAVDSLPASTDICFFLDGAFGGNENFVRVEKSGLTLNLSAQLLRVYWNANGSGLYANSLEEGQGSGSCVLGD